MVADGGTLAQRPGRRRRSSSTRSSAPSTRRRARRSAIWLDQQGRAFEGRGEDINDALGNLAPFAEDTNDVLEILDRQERATQQLVRDTGVVFDALTERQGQLQQLIVELEPRLRDDRRARRASWPRPSAIFPTFLDESRVTTDRLTEFANDTNPLVTQLRPAARELSPTLISLRGLAPDLKALFRDLDPLITVSKKGLPGARGLPQRDDAAARADRSVPAPAQPDPRLPRPLQARDRRVLRERRRRPRRRPSVPPGVATCRSTTCARRTRSTRRSWRRSRTASPTNRSNPYIEPRGYNEAEDRPRGVRRLLLHDNAVAPVSPARRRPSSCPSELRQQIQDFVYGGLSNGNVAPPCKEQAPLGPRLTDTPGIYPHVRSCARALAASRNLIARGSS